MGVIMLATGRVQLEIDDVAGRQVRLLIDGFRTAGRHEFSWDGRDQSNRAVPAGVYFARLKTEAQSESRRFVKLR